MKRLIALVLLALPLSSCGGDSPTTPTAPATQTRIIRIVGGPLNFGNIDVGKSSDWNLQIVNDGNTPLNVTGMTVPAGGGFTSSFTSGMVPANGGVQALIVRFSPTEPRSYSGTLTVQADHTSGTNTTSMTAVGLGPLFTRSGKGNTVFDMPSYVNRVFVQGVWDRTSTSNFIVRRNGSSFINEILRDSITYEGTHLVTGGGVIEIVSSAQISWTFTEVR